MGNIPLIKKFRDLKIEYKIWISMILLLAFLVTLVYLTVVLLFQQIILKDSLKRIVSSNDSCEDSLNTTYKEYMLNFNKIVGTGEFNTILTSIAKQSKSISQINTSLQQTMSSLSTASSLVDDVYLIDCYKNVYRSFGTYSKDISSLMFFKPEEVQGITIFPTQKSPFVPGNEVIPIVFPITLSPFSSVKYTVITQDPSEAIIFLTILVDATALNSSLNYWYNDFDSSKLYLMNDSGTLLNVSPYARESKEDFFSNIQVQQDLVQAFDQNTTTQFKLSEDYMTVSPLNSHLALVNITSSESLNLLFSELKRYTVLILTGGLLFTAFVTMLTSHFVSKPIARLVHIVQKIKNNTYNELSIPHSNDEVGQLNTAINQMYLTIKQQIEHIKYSEHEKYRAEIKLLAEQINPHLLYNTLEFINMEIYSNHTKEASAMVQSLADYMRISLSYGSERISIQQELSQVRAYLNIMNYRFHNSVLLLTYVPPELEEYLILKTTLQPFVENSIKHGFFIGNESQITFNPTIEIYFSVKEDKLQIDLSDNGIGFDAKTIYSILNNTNTQLTKHHMGLRNVMQRLEVSYPSVEIHLESIPYYKNTITILIPYQTEIDGGAA